MQIKYTAVSVQRRIIAISLCAVFLIAMIFIRLFYLQIFSGYALQTRRLSQWLRDLPITAKRGNITDRNGVALATSYTTYDCYVRKADITDKDNVVEVLSTSLEKTREEIVDLCNFLNKCGAHIVGAGTDTITIVGKDELRGTEYLPIGDRIIAGTYMLAVAICGGKLEICNANASHNKRLIDFLCGFGCEIHHFGDKIYIS